MPAIYLIFAVDISEIRLSYVLCVPEILRYAYDMHEICMKFAKDMAEILLRFS